MSEVKFGTISEPGIYDISLEAYHGQPCIGPSASGSDLVRIENYSPAHYWVTSKLNPDYMIEDASPTLAIGSAAHALILEGEEAFKAATLIKPEGHNGATKAGKAWVEDHRAEIDAGKTVISHDQWLMIQEMAKAVRAHPLAAKALSDGRPEQSLIWQDEPTGIWLKARPDWLPNNSRFCPNYKTAVSAKPDKFAKAAFDLGYHMKAALCIDGLERAAGVFDPVYFFVVQEKEPPFLTTVCVMKEEALDWARLLNRKAIDTLARCLEEADRLTEKGLPASLAFPGYTQQVVEIDMPIYIERTLDKRHERGDFTQTAIGA